MRAFIKAALESDGYRLCETASGKDGLAKAALQRPELIILDLGLPDLDGLKVIQALREWTPTPIIGTMTAGKSPIMTMSEHRVTMATLSSGLMGPM